MWLGLSKSIGSGFRIGVGTRLFSGRGRKGQTQREAAQLEKAEFLQRIAADTNSLREEYLVKNNIEPTIAEKAKLDVDALLQKHVDRGQYQAFAAAYAEVKELLEKIQYGGNLTAGRKDRLVDLVFELTKVVSASGSGLNDIGESVAQEYGRKSIITFGTIAGILFLLMTLGEPTSALINVPIAAVGAAVFYFPAHFVIGFLAKRKYAVLAKKRMREMFGAAV